MCQYCGTKRDLTIEHIPPISTAHLFVRNNKIKFWKIIACRECNLLISDQLIPTFADRFFQIKDLLIKKYEKHILREFRTVNTITSDDIRHADNDFFRTIDRIGFGLYSFDNLNETSIQILSKVIDSYGETIGALIANRSTLGLSFENNMNEENELDTSSSEHFDLDQFLLVIAQSNVKNQLSYEAIHENDILSSKLPPNPTKTFKLEWSILVDLATVENSQDFPSYADFIDILFDYGISNQNQYTQWYQKNKSGLVISISLPEFPDVFYECGWHEIENSIVEIDSESSNQADFAELELSENEVLRTLDMIISPRAVKKQLPNSILRHAIRKLGIEAEDDYQKLLELLAKTPYKSVFPDNMASLASK